MVVAKFPLNPLPLLVDASTSLQQADHPSARRGKGTGIDSLYPFIKEEVSGCNSGENCGILLCHNKAIGGEILDSGGIRTNNGHVQRRKATRQKSRG